MILLQLKDGPRRFNELRRLLPHVTQRMLTLQLRALERDGIIQRTVFGTILQASSMLSQVTVSASAPFSAPWNIGRGGRPAIA